VVFTHREHTELDWIRTQVQTGEYEFSEHAEQERQADKIPIADVERALLDAEMVEDYPDDPRGSKRRFLAALGMTNGSCLVLGYGSAGYPIHVVCGRSPRGTLRVITVYIPSLPKWLDARTRARR